MSVIPPVGVSGVSATAINFTQSGTSATNPASGVDFAKVLDNASALGVNADNLATQVATGQLPNIQAFTTAATKAQLAVDLTVAVRNRALEAYQEIMRMNV